MSLQVQDQEGGLVRGRKNGREFHRRKASQNNQPKIFKTYEDRRAEAEAARKRWAGVPAITQAREMIAEANLPGEKTAELLTAISKLNFEQLEEVVSSGKLAEILARLA